MNKPVDNLKAAHRGYHYQDLITAYFLADSLVHRYNAVTVDRKIVAGDKIDDLEVVHNGRRVRRQIKYSGDPTRCLSEKDFIQKNSLLRIDRLVRSDVQADGRTADEYRLCATWRIPDDKNFLSLLEPVDASPTVPSYQSRRFRFCGDRLWPFGRQPIWSWLEGGSLTRENVLTFCERFIIEVELPQASMTLSTPGPLEQALIDLLINRVGIGRYPNQDRLPEDVCALLLDIAERARGKQETLTPEDVEIQLKLRTDYGRISQAFPLDKHVYQDRQVLRPILRDTVLQGKHQIVTSPPGAGKSWELTKLADELKEDGVLIARHYCYLEPGDELVERRITADVLFGNLMGELTDAEPTLRSAAKQRYSAGPRELEELLERVAQHDRPVALIIDGIDHIARVLAEARTISDAEADIIDQLATLKIPSRVALIIGSQPGIHLDPLREAFGEQVLEREVPPWSEVEVTALARRLGLEAAFKKTGGQKPEPVLRLLAKRSEGNPLYATYLSRELTAHLEGGTVTDAEEWLGGAPVISGNIAAYYAYLYRHASGTAKAIADVLGVIDFGVSEAELREILPPPDRSWAPEALRHLSPILITASGQGGVRIFHESFRRFMTEELARQGRSVAGALAPVISWLQGRGFYQDAKAYRFLLPALRRAGRGDDALALVDVSFVSKSVAHGHPVEAIERNLALSLDIAARGLRWPALVRCVELSRSAHTCFEEKLHNPVTYWKTYLELFGPKALVERLLFDGRITQEPELGLILCSLAADSGATPPWREYLDVHESLSEKDEDEQAGSARDHAWKEHVSLARVHGRMSVEGFDALFESVLTFLIESGEHGARPSYVQALAKRIAQGVGREAVEEVITQGTEPERAPATLAPRVVALLRLGLAEALESADDHEGAAEAAQASVEGVDSPELAVACLRHGAPPHKASAHAQPPSVLDLGLDNHINDQIAEQVHDWVASVQLVANTDPAVIEAERDRVRGAGWYRCWLRFVITLAEVEAAKRAGRASPVIRTAFGELAGDVRPFVGTPRACDLFPIQGLIYETLKWGVSLLETKEEWAEALNDLQTVLDGTSVSLQRAPSGPIHLENVLEILAPYATLPHIGPIICSFAEAAVSDSDASGTYFEYHAERSMMLARILQAVGNTAGALRVWDRVGVYLGGYGFRKDITIYEILDSVPALMALGRDEAFRALTAAQPLADALLRHTDGRSTRRAPLSWFRNLLECDAPAGLALLAHSMSIQDATIGWPLEEALQESLKQTSDTADPIILEALYSTLSFEVEYENESENLAEERLAVVSRLLEQEPAYGIDATQRLTAQVSGDGRRYTTGAMKRVQTFAEEHGISVPIYTEAMSQTGASRSDWHGSHVRRRKIAEGILGDITKPYFPVNANSVELVASVRRAADSWRYESLEQARFVNTFGYRLVDLLQKGREEEAIRLIRFFARLYSTRDGAIHPIADIAQGLERHGYHRAASVAYGLAYVRTYGGGGWLTTGDAEHEWALLRGIELGRNEALEGAASEIAYLLRNISYNAGISCHLIERAASWGEPEVARDCWWAAYGVIKHRLPTETNRVGWFERFDPAQLPDWSIDDGLVAVLLGRINHPVLYRKVAALAGIARAIVSRPDVVPRALRFFLTRDACVSSLLLILETLLKFECDLYPITKATTDVLENCATSGLWGVRVLARRLLERAGLSGPACVRDIPCVQGVTLSDDQIDILLSADVGNRLEQLGRVWPDLPQLTARHLHTIIEGSDVHKARCRERYELAYGEHGNVRPPTPVLYWESELLETALHETLNGLHAHLWTTGSWSSEIDLDILSQVLPNVIAHLGVHASRVARPPYPPPTTVMPGRRGILALDDDPLYPGWRREAYIEYQWVRGDNSGYRPPTELVTVFAGAIAEPLGSALQPDEFPFSQTNVMDWWRIDGHPPDLPPHLPLGPLTYLTRVTDWLGDALVLIPPIRLRTYMNLQPPGLGMPLVWRDRKGEPAVVFRKWRVRDKEQIWSEPLEYEGSDLLMRPDVHERLQTLAGVTVKELLIRSRKPINAKSANEKQSAV